MSGGCLSEDDVFEYVSGAPSPQQIERVVQHVDSCPDCRRLLVLSIRDLSLRSRHLQSSGTTDANQSGRAEGARRLPTVDTNNYRIEREHARGGIGRVFAAEDLRLHRPVAVKELLSDGAGAADRFLREAELTARLQHPSIVPVYEAGYWPDGRPFYAMKFISGRPLGQLIAEGETLAQRLALLPQVIAVAEAMAYAHSKRIIHRDLKPANIVIGEFGETMVVDWGLGKDLSRATLETTAELPNGSPTPQQTVEGALLGTPAFMSPEQAAGEAVDERTDVYALGAILYTLLAGRPPFVTGQLSQLLTDVITQRLDPVENVQPGVPPELAAIVKKAMAVDRTRRYVDAGKLVRDLTRFQAGQLVGAHHYSTWTLTRRWLARHRTRIGWGIVVPVLVGALVLAYRATRHDRRLVCRGAEAKLAGIWDEGRKRAAHDAFLATGLPYAEAAFRSVERALDAQANAWVSMHTEACEATRVRRDQSEESLDLRMQCLGERLHEIRAQADLFASADQKVVERTPQITSALSPLEGCADLAALRSMVPLPANPTLRARVEEVRRRVAQSAALGMAGKYKEELALAAPAVEASRALGYRPLESQALAMLGFAQSELGDVGTAEKSLEDAELAARAGRDTVSEVNAWGYLIGNAQQQAHYERALEYGRHGFAAFEALGHADERPLARLLYALARIYADQGKYAEALDYSRRELAIRQHADGPESTLAALSHEAVARVLGNVGRYVEAESEVRRALAIQEKLLGPDHPAFASSLFNLAYALFGQGRYDEALAYYRRNVAIWEASFGRDHPRLAIPLANIGDILRIQGKYDAALQYDRRALAITEKARGPEHPDVALALNNIGDVLRLQGNPNDAIVHYERALTIWEKAFGPQHGNVAVALTGIGRAELDRHQPARALRSLERALAIRAVVGGDPSWLPETRFAVARALWSSGRDRERARSLADQARAGYAVAGKGSERELAEVDSWLADRAVSAHSGQPAAPSN
jgi:tetratricopeptide (TPR) repeat protein